MVWQALCSAQQFAAVMQRGRIIAKTAHFSLHAVHLPHTPVPRTPMGKALLFAPVSSCFYGMLLSKRWAAKAVRRNLIKRQIRSMLYQHAPLFQLPSSHVALVVRLHHGWDKQQFISAASNRLRVAVRQELLELFQHANWHKAPTLATAPTH